MERVNRKLAIGLALGAIALSSAAAQPGRTVYEIEVSAAGTKSQGLRGILYDDRGQRVDDGPVVRTPIGSFRWIPCRMLWDSCGRWRDGSALPASSYPPENRSALRYRITYEERGGRTYWSGELPGLGADAARRRRVETPMGMFRWTTGRMGAAQWQGWVPQDWPDLPLVRTEQRTAD